MLKRIPDWANKMGQQLADTTSTPTQAVRTPDRLIRFTHQDWPLSGQFLKLFTPVKQEVSK